MYSNRHRQPRASRAIKLAALWTLIGGTALGVGATAFIMQSQPPSALSLCQRGSEIAESTLVLIDTTDALSETHKARLRATIERERDHLALGAKYSVLLINPDAADAPIEIVSACNPGRGDDVNPIFSTASRTEKLWQEQFGKPVGIAINKAGENGTADRSPILQSISAVLTRPDFDARVAKRRLVIVSDMLEHEERYSQLSGDFIEGYRQSNLARLAPLDLHGAAIAIDYLQRPAFAAIQGAAHRAFWKNLFMEAGAIDVAFIGMTSPAAPEMTSSFDPLPPKEIDEKPKAKKPTRDKAKPARKSPKKAQRRK